MKAPGRLSVGELLLEGDLTARRLLLEWQLGVEVHCGKQ